MNEMKEFLQKQKVKIKLELDSETNPFVLQKLKKLLKKHEEILKNE